MGGMRAIAVFMIVLVLSIPFYVSAVFADANKGIINATIIGTDGVENIVRPEDILLMTVIADNDDAEITTDMIRLSVPGSEKFKFSEVCQSGCRPYDNEGELYECTCQNSFRVYEPKHFSFHLYNDTEGADNKHIDDYGPVDVFPDKFAPGIMSVSYELGTSSINLSYKLNDTAHPETRLCSGLADVEFYVNNAFFEGITLDNRPCSYENKTELELEEGINIIYIKVYDYFGNYTQSEPIDIVTDYTLPALPDNFAIFKDDREIRAISTIGPESQIIGATVVFQVEEHNLSNVTADLSSLNINPAVARGYGHIVGRTPGDFGIEPHGTECKNVNRDTFECRFSDIYVDIDSAGVSDDIELSIDVTAEDVASNIAEKTLKLSLEIDNTAPLVSFLGTNHCANDICYVNEGAGNKVIIRIAETGSGFSQYDFNGVTGYRIILNLASFGPKYNNPVVMTNCEQGDGTWTCYGYADVDETANNAGERLRIAVTDTSADDLGNRFDGITQAFVIYDPVDPELVGEVDASSSCPISEESLVLQFDVKEELSGMKRVYADTSEISSVSFHEGGCEETGSAKYHCTLAIGALTSTYTRAVLELMLEDNAGNIGKHNYPVEVCEAETTTANPNFWRSSIGSGGKISRRTLSFIAVPVFVSIPLTPISGNPEIININPDCSDTHLVIDSVSILDADKEHPILNVKLGKQSLAGEGDGELQLNCTLSIISRNGIYVYTNPEKEEIEAVIDIFDTVLGTIDKKVEAKIDKAIERHHKLEGYIDDLEKINSILGTLANLGYAMAATKIVLTLAIDALVAVSTTLVLIGLGLQVIPIVGTLLGAAAIAAGEGIWHIASNVLGGAFLVIDTFFWSSSFWPKPGSIAKWAIMLYSCQLCDFEGASKIQLNYESEPVQYNWINLVGIAEGAVGVALAGPVGLVAVIPALTPGSSYDWNPYKSIHTARSCLCLPALEYNYRKEQQINCEYIKCLRESAEMGLPPDQCDAQKKAHECLYVDGAAWKLIGWGQGGWGEFAGFFQQLAGFIFQNILYIGTVIAYTATCDEAAISLWLWEWFLTVGNPVNPVFSWSAPYAYAGLACVNFNGAVTAIEIAKLTSLTNPYDWNTYYGPLESNDRCGGIE